jgi:2-polyprenyl-3-methyl-5-hydroxy-6-metoxy-1,4-benzoquinol methylase
MNAALPDNDRDGQHLPRWYHEDNGFSSREAMELAHQPLVACARRVLSAGAGRYGPRRRVLDLGCGNGALVRAIARLHVGVVPAGVDVAAARVRHARRLLPGFAGEFRVGNLFHPASLGPTVRRNFLVILMLGRLIEVPRERALALLTRLKGRTCHLLVYAYEDYIRQTMPLSAMSARVGLQLLGVSSRANVCLARMPDSASTRPGRAR